MIHNENKRDIKKPSFSTIIAAVIWPIITDKALNTI